MLHLWIHFCRMSQKLRGIWQSQEGHTTYRLLLGPLLCPANATFAHPESTTEVTASQEINSEMVFKINNIHNLVFIRFSVKHPPALKA